MAGASEDALTALVREAPIDLPNSYIEQLRASDGGEGDICAQPGWICFWPAAAILDLNRDYGVAENLPGFFAFASDGGGEILVFDIRKGPPFPIVAVPFVVMAEEDAKRVAESFDELRSMIGKSWPVE